MEIQVVIAQNLVYLDESGAGKLLVRLDELGRIVNGLLKALERAH